jgi:hypothetical protein
MPSRAGGSVADSARPRVFYSSPLRTVGGCDEVGARTRARAGAARGAPSGSFDVAPVTDLLKCC